MGWEWRDKPKQGRVRPPKSHRKESLFGCLVTALALAALPAGAVLGLAGWLFGGQ